VQCALAFIAPISLLRDRVQKAQVESSYSLFFWVFFKRTAGDYGFDPLRIGSNPTLLPYFKEAELMNGRWVRAFLNLRKKCDFSNHGNRLQCADIRFLLVLWDRRQLGI